MWTELWSEKYLNANFMQCSTRGTLRFTHLHWALLCFRFYSVFSLFIIRCTRYPNNNGYAAEKNARKIAVDWWSRFAAHRFRYGCYVALMPWHTTQQTDLLFSVFLNYDLQITEQNTHFAVCRMRIVHSLKRRSVRFALYLSDRLDLFLTVEISCIMPANDA